MKPFLKAALRELLSLALGFVFGVVLLACCMAAMAGLVWLLFWTH